MKEAQTATFKLDNYVISWSDLERVLGVEGGSLSARFNTPMSSGQQEIAAPGRAGDDDLHDARDTESAAGSDPALATDAEKPSRSLVQEPAPNRPS
jgi:hypothetical protein